MANFTNIFNTSDTIASNITSTTIVPRNDFFTALSNWDTTPSMNFLFCVKYEMPSLLVDQQMQYWSENLIRNSNWGIDNAITKLVKPFDKKITGCFLVTDVDIPQEETNVGYAGINNRGFKYSPYMKNRVEPRPFTLNFLETNTSFVDSIIRPHIILSSHLGLVTRKEGNIKTDLTIYELGKTGNSSDSLFIRKTWLFKGCVPRRVNSSPKNYSSNSAIQTRKTEWIYTQYQLLQGS